MKSLRTFGRDVCVIGGGGHVGLPLAITFADVGLRTVIYDINQQSVEAIRNGVMPFAEEGGPEMLRRALASGKLEVHDSADVVSDCEFLLLIVGTPIDEHLNPNFTTIQRSLEGCGDSLRDGQVLILRSTVFPGISNHIRRHLESRGLDIGVAFCPERVAQGHSLREFRQIPQIVSAFDRRTLARVRQLFGPFNSEFIEMEPMEAELCKLMTNAWRYLQFAAVNQFYMIASQHDLDFDRILHGCRHNYPRMAGMPGPGFAAGPCLVKDTMQLAAFSRNGFVLGHAAMLINEGLPAHLIQLAKREVERRGLDLSGLSAGVLGMAFKAESDDPRGSLSYKLRKLLTLECREVLCTDPYVSDPTLFPPEAVVERSDVLFVATPHAAYRGLDVPAAEMVPAAGPPAHPPSGVRPPLEGRSRRVAAGPPLSRRCPVSRCRGAGRNPQEPAMRLRLPKDRPSYAWLGVGLVTLVYFLALVVPWRPVDFFSGYTTLEFSWRLALNYELAAGRQWGKDFVFTYGPLGFLADPVYQPATY